jgi:hypothetical protein
MKLLQVKGGSSGFSKEELATYKFIVYGNIITQMKVLISAMEQLGISFGEKENEVCSLTSCFGRKKQNKEINHSHTA